MSSYHLIRSFTSTWDMTDRSVTQVKKHQRYFGAIIKHEHDVLMIHHDIMFSPGLASIKIKADRNLCKLDIKQKGITISTISLQFSSLHQNQFWIYNHHKQDSFQIVMNNLRSYEHIKIFLDC